MKHPPGYARKTAGHHQSEAHKIIGKACVINTGQKTGKCPVCLHRIQNLDDALEHVHEMWR